ncbi:MAG TPA: hypothetical protein VH760_11760 [Gaiellaceae bacterium]
MNELEQLATHRHALEHGAEHGAGDDRALGQQLVARVSYEARPPVRISAAQVVDDPVTFGRIEQRDSLFDSLLRNVRRDRFELRCNPFGEGFDDRVARPHARQEHGHVVSFRERQQRPAVTSAFASRHEVAGVLVAT